MTDNITPSVFPTEVFEEIIDAVGGSRRPQRTLQNCALTCKLWVPRSQLNLFRSVIVAPVGAEQIHRLVQVLDGSPHLRELVREIKVSMSKRPGGEQFTTREAVEILPILVSGKVPTLRALSVSAVNPNAAPLILHRAFFTSLTRLRSITTLKLYDVRFSSFGELGRMLHILVNLRSVKCSHVRWQSPGSYRFPPDYDGSCNTTHLRWEGANDRPDTLLLAPGTAALLTAASRTLVKLSIDVREFGTYVQRLCCSTSPFTALRILRVNWKLGSEDTPEENGEMAAALANSGSPTLQHFTMRFSAERDAIALSGGTHEHVEAIGRGLDGGLSGPSFPALRTIVVHGGYTPWLFEPTWWWAELAEAFPKTHKKGTLHLCGTRRNPEFRRLVPQEVEFSMDGQESLWLF